MNDEHDDAPASPIDFDSPGRFAVLNPDSELPAPEPWQAAPFVLGQEAALQRFNTPQQTRPHALALIQQARRSLCLFSPDLEAWLYNHSSMQEAFSGFLLRQRQSQLRILLQDSGRAVREGHRLLALVRKLSSHAQIRRCHPDYPAPEGAFLLADDQGLLLRPQADDHSGHAHYRDPARVRQLQRQFDQSWDTSISDPDLRSFVL